MPFPSSYYTVHHELMPISAMLLVLLGFITAVGPVSTDMYLPAFPAIDATFGAQAGAAQVTLATWFLGLAVGQVMQGSLSDRFGRRTPLLIGMMIYAAASVGCALAPNLLVLSLCRFVAAIGGSAGMVLPRAIVRDRCEGLAQARAISRLTLVMGVAPILAPSLGGLVLIRASWHAIFWICAAFGVVSAACVWAFLPDTLPRELRISLDPWRTAQRFGVILRERGFLSNALAGGFSLFGMFAYLGGSPIVFERVYHLSPGTYGALFGCCAAGYILASQASPRLVAIFGFGPVMRAAVQVYLAASLSLLGLAAWGGAPWQAMALCVMICLASLGFVLPNAIVGALARHATRAGSASALMGTMQFLLGAVSGLSVGLLDDGTARPMAAIMSIGAIAAMISERARPRPAPVGHTEAKAQVRIA